MRWMAKICAVAVVFMIPDMRAEAQAQFQNRYQLTQQQALDTLHQLRRQKYLYELRHRRTYRRSPDMVPATRRLSDYPYCRTGTFGRITNKPCRPRLHTRGVRKGSRR